MVSPIYLTETVNDIVRIYSYTCILNSQKYLIFSNILFNFLEKKDILLISIPIFWPKCLQQEATGCMPTAQSVALAM